MTVSRDEAAAALAEVSAAGDKVVRLKGYHYGAPHFVIWGLVWLAANSVTQVWPGLANVAWGAGVVSGAVVSTITGLIQSRDMKPHAGSPVDLRASRRMGMTFGVMSGFIACMMMIAQPATQREANAMISIIFPFMYMAAGVWAGWRLFAIGLVSLVAILVGYYAVQEYFALWMGVFAGGSLIAGGIWLRTA